MDNKQKGVVMIPFVAHESAMNRMERIIKLLIAIIIILILGIAVYLYLPTEVAEENTQSVNDIQDSEINQNIGE